MPVLIGSRTCYCTMWFRAVLGSWTGTDDARERRSPQDIGSPPQQPWLAPWLLKVPICGQDTTKPPLCARSIAPRSAKSARGRCCFSRSAARLPSASRFLAAPTGLWLKAQGWRAALTLGKGWKTGRNPNGVVTQWLPATTPLGLPGPPTHTQGSSCLATLGFATESRWDSPPRPLQKLR